MSEAVDSADGRRPRGRPRLAIDHDAIADAVAALFAEGGYEAVSIIDTADKLGVSRATLYRSVPTKEDLLGILFERCTQELTERSKKAVAESDDPAEQLKAMIRLQAEAAISMRSYMAVFFGGAGLPPEVYSRWQVWSRKFERRWLGVVKENMSRGYLDDGDPLVVTRLILGMIIWVSRWYKPADKLTAEQIAETAIHLVGLDSGTESAGAPRPAAKAAD